MLSDQQCCLSIFAPLCNNEQTICSVFFFYYYLPFILEKDYKHKRKAKAKAKANYKMVAIGRVIFF
jgi:hypothetical protein